MSKSFEDWATPLRYAPTIREAYLAGQASSNTLIRKLEKERDEALNALRLRMMQITDLKQRPDGWLLAADEEMVGAHLGIANEADTYEVAKKKLHDLICWHIQVATDPKVNGGYKLVPVKPTEAMLDAYINNTGRFSSARSDWEAMLNAAPTREMK